MKKFVLILLLIIPQLCQNVMATNEADNSIWDIISRMINTIIEAIDKIPSKITEGIGDLFSKILDLFATSIVSSVSSVFSSLFYLDLGPIRRLVDNTSIFISNIAFSLSYLSFFISLGLYVLPVSEEWSAKGKNGLVDSCLCVILLSMSPMIHSFFIYLSDSLSFAIMSSIDQASSVKILMNILLSMVSGLFFLLLLDSVALLIAFALIVISFILSSIAPILFLIAIMVYSLPLQIAKNTANKIFVNSIVCYFLTPIGWSIIALTQVIFSMIVNPLTPLIVLFFDIAILYVSFSVSKEIGTYYPILGFIRKSLNTAVFIGALYLTSGKFSKSMVLGSGLKKINRKGGEEDE